MEANQNNETVVHYNCKCSKCGQSPIKGIRYYCLQCPNFNYCSLCERRYGERHGHQLLMLRRAEDYEMFKNFVKKDSLLEYFSEDEEKIIDLSKCQVSAMNLKKTYVTRNNNNFIPIELIIKNTGEEQWPSTCYFTCDENSQVKGEKVKLSRGAGKVGEEYTLKIKIILSNIKKTGTYKSIWQLKDEKGDEFGEKFTIIIKDIFEKDSNSKDYRDELEEKVNEVKMKYSNFSSARIKNALIKTRGNVENAVKMLITESKKKNYSLK